MLTRGYTLAEFINDMEALIDSGAEQATIFDRGAPWLERLISTPRYE